MQTAPFGWVIRMVTVSAPVRSETRRSRSPRTAGPLHVIRRSWSRIVVQVTPALGVTEARTRIAP